MEYEHNEKAWCQLIDIYSLYRMRIVNEDCLVHYRLSWFLMSQAALFLLWSGILSEHIKLPPMVKMLLILLIGICGIAAGVASVLAVSAAYNEIERISKLYEEQVLKFDVFKEPLKFLPELKSPHPLHWHGRFYAIVLPVAAMIAWGLICIVALGRLVGQSA